LGDAQVIINGESWGEMSAFAAPYTSVIASYMN
jgi:hypothetical protein